jgi:DDE superfamily endonuclease
MALPLVFATGCLPCAALSRLTSPPSRPTSWPAPTRSCAGGRPPPTCASGPLWPCYSTVSPTCRIPRQRPASACNRSPSANGGGAGPTGTSLWRTSRAGGARPAFPPLDQAVVKAIACEAVFQTERPLSRQSLADLTERSCAALGKPVSRSTVWRILHTAALKPWRYEYWIFPRDPQFTEKAGVVLDLYAGFWQGAPLTAKDCILSADEKTSIQARLRCHPGLGPAPGRPRRVEYEYERGGALQYLAAWDVRRGHVSGRCEPATGIEPFGRLVEQVMAREPYCSAERVFWVVDNGSSHRGRTSVERLTKAYPKATLVHTPVHASWLNQVEIYFSLVQRKVLTPNDFASLAELEQRLRLYEELSNRRPCPFDWKFDRAKLLEFLARVEAKRLASQKPDTYL